MKLTEQEKQEIQEKYSYLTNYEAEDPTTSIDPLDYVDSNGDGLLHIAVQREDARTVELLLNAGVDVNSPGDMGSTALHGAQTKQMADLLLKYGASNKIRNEFGEFPNWGV